MPAVENPILLDLPDFFETERLFVRFARPGDGPIVYQAVMESLPELKQWLRWAHRPQSLEETEMYQRQAAADALLRQRFTLLTFLKNTTTFVGRLSLHNVDWSVPKLEIGYWLHTAMAGHGYMSEAVRGLTDFAFMHMRAERMVIMCDDRNEKSAAVARRAGYTLEGIMRSDMRELDDTLSSGMVFSMLRREWESSKTDPT